MRGCRPPCTLPRPPRGAGVDPSPRASCPALVSKPLPVSCPLRIAKTYRPEVSVQFVVLPQIGQEAGGCPGGLLTVGAGGRGQGSAGDGHPGGQVGGNGPHLSRFFLMKTSLRSPSKYSRSRAATGLATTRLLSTAMMFTSTSAGGDFSPTLPGSFSIR